MTILALEHHRPPTDDRILIESILYGPRECRFTDVEIEDNK